MSQWSSGSFVRLRRRRTALTGFGLALPQHVVAELPAVGAVLRERRELLPERRVGVRALVLFERAPVGDDRKVLVGFARPRQRALVGHEAREPEHLAADEAALVAAVRRL